MRTFGVEEELLLVDAGTGVTVALADLVARPESGDDAAAGDHDAPPTGRQPGRRLAGAGTPAVAHRRLVSRPWPQ